MTRRRLQTIALAVALLAFALAAVQYRRAAVLRGEALAAAQRGAAWLLAQDGPLKDPAIPWIVSAVDARYCAPRRASEWVRRGFEEFDGRRDPIYTALRALALDARDEELAAFTERWRNHTGKGNAISAMAYGAYCDRLPRPDVVGRTVLGTPSATGYELTHRFLALLYLEQNGCLAGDEPETVARAAQALAAEQHADGAFSDLFAERLALLLYGGRRDLVASAWIETTLAAQQPSGAWSDPTFPRRFYKTPENPQTTALAVWALAEYAGACPF